MSMALICGFLALTMGFLSFIGSIIRAARLERQESHENEMGAIGWFILAALCLK